MMRPKSTGMLTGGKNVLEMPCYQVNRTVPYFKELSPSEGRSNEVVFDRFMELAKNNLSITLKHLSMPGSEHIPDGII